MYKCGKQVNQRTWKLWRHVSGIIEERQIKHTDFARDLGISANYVYLLTGGRKTSISETLARLIERTYGYSAPVGAQREKAGTR